MSDAPSRRIAAVYHTNSRIVCVTRQRYLTDTEDVGAVPASSCWPIKYTCSHTHR